MNNTTIRFTFKHVDKSQRDLIHTWLKQNYIREWIHGQGLENTFIGLDNFFKYQEEEEEFDLTSEITQHWIGYDGDRPFVYLLTSNVIKNEDSVYAKYSESDEASITLDMFIGDPEYLGKGLASVVIKEFLLTHFSDVSEVFIDPEKKNARAVHVYEKTGFHKLGEFIAVWHPVPHYIMKLEMRDLLQ